MKVIQIVGYKNSGKTTVASSFIEQARQNGYTVGSCKHHAHGTPHIIETTDSAKHLQAGANVTAVQGGGRLDVSIQREIPLQTILSCYETFGVDFVIVEGYKQELYPKIVLLRDERDQDLLQLENIIAVVTDESLVTNVPTFKKKEYGALFQFVQKRG